jgi:glucose-1-phosphate cytidylyltransferase
MPQRVIPVVILAGGLGTRLREETVVRPKPMVEIGSRPILWHIMKLYGHYGFRKFIVPVGYKGEMIKDYFLNYRNHQSDFTISLATGEITHHVNGAEDWEVTVADTGASTATGGRIKRVSPLIDGRFMATYGDGVADIDIGRLLAFHEAHGRLATVTAVRPPARFGTLELDGASVRSFSEKPQAGAGWINGGFFVFDPGVLDYIEGDDTLLEREPLERLATNGQLMAYMHEGYWEPMDTQRDLEHLNRQWQDGSAPWKVWND